MLLFLHDCTIAERLKSTTSLQVTDDWPHPARYCPPCGVIPFMEFASYITPIAYVRSEVVQVYYTFREMYLRYFQLLHSINSHPQGLLYLCATFESLVIACLPDLMLHFRSINIEPLRFAYHWMMTAFSGFIPVEELLQLWDRIIGFDDMRLLSILAAGVFYVKKPALMQAGTLTSVKKTLKNLNDVKVIATLQQMLFYHDLSTSTTAIVSVNNNNTSAASGRTSLSKLGGGSACRANMLSAAAPTDSTTARFK